jgi:hypothetical protein
VSSSPATADTSLGSIFTNGLLLLLLLLLGEGTAAAMCLLLQQHWCRHRHHPLRRLHSLAPQMTARVAAAMHLPLVRHLQLLLLLLLLLLLSCRLQ